MNKLTCVAAAIFLIPCNIGLCQSDTTPGKLDLKSDAVSIDEASVRPGVNKSFVDPNLNVDAFIKKFEIESREVYLNRERILAACEIEKGDTVADVGAGTGLFTRMFSQEVGNDRLGLRRRHRSAFYKTHQQGSR